MKRIFKTVFIITTVMCLVWACKKIEVGYLSDHVKYPPTIYLTKGTYYVSPAITHDGSTLPLKVEMLEIRDKETGQVATDLITPRPILVWKKVYDYRTDRTEAQVMAKLELKDLPAFELNSVSGQIRFNTNTAFATGESYEADMRISNVRGSKDYPGIAQIVLNPLIPIVWTGQTTYSIRDKVNNSVLYSFDENVNIQSSGKSAVFKVTKISDASAPGITVSFKVVDKNGTPFSPKNGEVLPSYPGSVLPSFGDCSINTENNDDAIVYHFPVLPFPFYTWYNNAPLMYYHVVDGFGAIDVKGFNPARSYYARLRTNMKIFEPGTWEIKVTFPYVTHK